MSQWQQDTFDPSRFAEHAELERASRRDTTLPAPLPPVRPLAVRPPGWRSRTEQLFGDRGEGPVVDLEGVEADKARRAFFDDTDDDEL